MFKKGDVVSADGELTVLVTIDQTEADEFSGEVISSSIRVHYIGFVATNWRPSVFEVVTEEVNDMFKKDDILEGSGIILRVTENQRHPYKFDGVVMECTPITGNMYYAPGYESTDWAPEIFNKVR